MYEMTDILKKYFKTLYKNTDIPWTEENDKDMEKLEKALITNIMYRDINDYKMVVDNGGEQNV